MAIGMALTMAPATDSIMGSLPLGQGGRRLGGQRHHPPGRRRARRRDHRQRARRRPTARRSATSSQGKPVPSGTAKELEQSLGLALGREQAGSRARRRRDQRVHRRPARRRAGGCGCRPDRHGDRVRVASGPCQLRRARRVGRRSSLADAGSGADASRPARRGRHPVTSTEVPRRLGRPRSTEVDEAIMVATIEVFAEVGLEGLTVEGVAAGAPVSARRRSTAATRARSSSWSPRLADSPRVRSRPPTPDPPATTSAS